MFTPRKMKSTVVILCLALFISMLPIATGVAFAQDLEVPWAQAYNKLSDPDTSDSSAVFSATEIENGRLWTDKSVNKDSANIYDARGGIVETLDAKADEFLITLSALSEGYSLDSYFEPIDAVFIIDLSGSMTYGFTGDTEGAPGSRRVDALADALNEAVTTLMEANAENRVAVVGYGGLSGRIPMSYPILALDRYSVPTGQSYFSVSGTAPTAVYFDVNENIAAESGASITPASIHVNGGTPTQRGIYAGAQILMNNTDKTYTYPSTGRTVTRQPVMMLLTDGEPTFGWTDYINPGTSGDSQNWGDAITPDMGIDILTVLTASYWKKQVSQWYYGAQYPTKAALFYTIGMYINNVHSNAVLDPAHNAALNSKTYQSVVYNMSVSLWEFTTFFGYTTFPILNRLPGSTIADPTDDSYYSLLTLNNVDNYISSFDYTDGFYQAEDAAALKSIFETITTQIIAPGDLITEIDPEGPNFSGYLTFSDVLGQYLEFRSYEGLWYDDVHYTGESFAQDIGVDGASSPNWTTFISTLATQMEISDAEAEDLVLSSIAGGILYYSSPTDYGNQIRWYADSDKYFVGPYYNSADGSLAPVPSDATCIMDLYVVDGMVSSSVTSDSIDLTTINFAVLTALVDGDFTDDDQGQVLHRQLIAGQQIVRFYIPASLIPMRTVFAENPDNQTSNLAINDVPPIRALFSVGPQASIPTPGAIGTYPFFTNQWDIDSNITTAFCRINPLNPYYHYIDWTGRVPLFVADGSGGYRLANVDDTGPFFAAVEHFDLNAAGYLVIDYVPVVSSLVVTGDGAPYIESGTARFSTADLTQQKSENITQSLSFVTRATEFIPPQSTYHMQLRQLGNNGRFEIPITNVLVEKVWKDLTPVPIQVQLHALVGTSTTDVTVGAPLDLSAATGWSGTWSNLAVYTLKPNAAGNVSFIAYSVEEVFAGDPPAGWTTSYVQPSWNEAAGTWSLATITNTGQPPMIPPIDPPVKPPILPPKTGDAISVFLWFSMLAAALNLIQGSLSWRRFSLKN